MLKGLTTKSISRQHKYKGKDERIALLNSFIYSNFNYCPLVWHFCSFKPSRKVEAVRKCCLQLIRNDFENLLMKNKTATMEIRRLRVFSTWLLDTYFRTKKTLLKLAHMILASKVNFIFLWFEFVQLRKRFPLFFRLK